MSKIEDLIKFYQPLLHIAGTTPPYLEVMKLHKEFISKVKDLKNAEDDIVVYLQNGIKTGEWKNENLWIASAITHPLLTKFIIISFFGNKTPLMSLLLVC